MGVIGRVFPSAAMRLILRHLVEIGMLVALLLGMQPRLADAKSPGDEPPILSAVSDLYQSDGATNALR
jgi:hypothetical protein